MEEQGEEGIRRRNKEEDQRKERIGRIVRDDKKEYQIEKWEWGESPPRGAAGAQSFHLTTAAEGRRHWGLVGACDLCSRPLAVSEASSCRPNRKAKVCILSICAIWCAHLLTSLPTDLGRFVCTPHAACVPLSRLAY